MHTLCAQPVIDLLINSYISIPNSPLSHNWDISHQAIIHHPLPNPPPHSNNPKNPVNHTKKKKKRKSRFLQPLFPLVI
ncbi:hypothetical protein EYC80_000404 [Monilinia laxa]|uniref:Uncharacterized protein n=1 Tax=Monilinia laxa TaxID=61186 RepID=A0A5N6KAI4_MONLA|nr:hypothetical protein EYC80_000404 [Monilinia laxa]